MGEMISAHVNTRGLAVVFVNGEVPVNDAGSFGGLGPGEDHSGTLYVRPVNARTLVTGDVYSQRALGYRLSRAGQKSHTHY